MALEVWLISSFAPSWIEGLSCEPRWFPPLDCEMPIKSLEQGRFVALLIVWTTSGLALLIWFAAQRASVLPFALFTLGLFTFAGLADLIMGASASARSEILFGAEASIQITAAAALALALVIVPSASPAVFLRLHMFYLFVAAFRLLGLISLLSIWLRVPSAIAVSTLIALVLIPGIVAAAVIIAAVAGRTHKWRPTGAQ